MKAIQTNTLFFDRCKAKLEMYIETGKNLISKVWDDLWVTKNGNSIQFYNGCDLIVEISRGSYAENLETAVIWLLSGQRDPLKHYN
jgi:hypothetical protein